MKYTFLKESALLKLELCPLDQNFQTVRQANRSFRSACNIFLDIRKRDSFELPCQVCMHKRSDTSTA